MSAVASLYPHISPAHLADAEEQFAAMRAALDERNARGLGPRRSDGWLAELAVDAAIRGVKVGWLWA
ncbi:hypothetical protein [Sorangium sp. So ce233]|uniref:hypothetical protein n=1 Tax=Sorangium sp. So ce233 TaxID=3133290 RepID=UPI003F5ECD98